jgi:DNA-damage-inducible protein D
MKNKNPENHIALFRGKTIRRVIYQNEWWFSVADVVEALTDTVDVRDYIKKMRKRDRELDSYWGTNCPLLEMIAKDGKKRKITSANAEGIFRIIQSIPSSKAEPFKRWLARVGYERVQEIEDPELATKRTRALYKSKGYSESWIEKRMRGIAIREDLTDEWQKRGVKEDIEFAILTAEISKATFGMTPSQYKNFKGLKRENLRDHMDDLELIFSMLGEASTTKIAKNRNTQGFIENKTAAQKGGKIAGDARKKLEIESGGKVITRKNYLTEPQNRKKLKNNIN